LSAGYHAFLAAEVRDTDVEQDKICIDMQCLAWPDGLTVAIFPELIVPSPCPRKHPQIAAKEQNKEYANDDKLKEAGVAVTAIRYNGMIHDFVLLNAIHDVAGVQAALEQSSNAIRDALKQ
jgi:acetyl esterase/lipase